MLNTYVIVFLVSYLIGMISWAWIFGAFFERNLKEEGSGNLGATNVARSLGKGLGIACFLLDGLKGFVAIALADCFFPEASDKALIFALAGVILGHCYPVIFKWKGGKGVSSAMGALLYICPLGVLFAGLIFVGVFYLTGYVSAASLLSFLVLPLILLPLGVSFSIIQAVFTLALFLVWTHRSNLRRLWQGAENSFKKS